MVFPLFFFIRAISPFFDSSLLSVISEKGQKRELSPYKVGTVSVNLINTPNNPILSQFYRWEVHAD